MHLTVSSINVNVFQDFLVFIYFVLTFYGLKCWEKSIYDISFLFKFTAMFDDVFIFFETLILSCNLFQPPTMLHKSSRGRITWTRNVGFMSILFAESVGHADAVENIGTVRSISK